MIPNASATTLPIMTELKGEPRTPAAAFDALGAAAEPEPELEAEELFAADPELGTLFAADTELTAAEVVGAPPEAAVVEAAALADVEGAGAAPEEDVELPANIRFGGQLVESPPVKPSEIRA